MSMQGNYYKSDDYRRNVAKYSRLGLSILSVLVVLMLSAIITVAILQGVNNRSHNNEAFYQASDSCNKYISLTKNAIKFGQLEQAAIYHEKSVYYWNEEVKLINKK